MADIPEGAVILHGIEGAFVELDDQGRSIYDYDACIGLLAEGNGGDFDAALEHWEFNVLGSRDSCYPSVFFQGWDDRPDE